jgi:hypothetical protein
MSVLEINHENEQLFFKIHPSIYHNDDFYIAPIKQDLQKIFDPTRNKLFKMGGKAKRWVLINHQREVIGRIAAFINPKTLNSQNMKVGGIGFFECINDQTAANTLFETTIKWLKSEQIEAIDGPINFGERDQFWGLLVENFKVFNSYGLNYNPPYYQQLFENFGFKTYFEQYVFWRTLERDAEDVFKLKSQKILQNPDFKVITAEKLDKQQISAYFLEVYNSAWAGIPGFKEMRLEQAQIVVKSLWPIIDKRIIFFAMMKDKAIGFYINIPELNEFFQYVNGNMNWLGKLKFLYHFKTKKRKRMVGIVFGVDRNYHGRGVDGAIITKAGEVVVKNNMYQETIITWVGDFNLPMLKVVNELGVERQKTLITYRYLFNREQIFQRCPYVGQEKTAKNSVE